jgi:hypothetical protein
MYRVLSSWRDKLVTCCINEDVPAAHCVAGTAVDYPFLVEGSRGRGPVSPRSMERLGASRVRPLRGLLVIHTLEGEHYPLSI